MQPNLFEINARSVDIDRVVLYALGEFQSRGKVLAARELPLDRLRGALRRAAEKFETAELSDEAIAEHLEKLGAKIVKVPNFVAKHPFRITVSLELAEKAKTIYQNSLEND
ncbi:MAG: hypothetical protein M3033_03000 [Acidobacteriota bacterium]|nr:hypothetical protein [Acidobacteriota bacterium]